MKLSKWIVMSTCILALSSVTCDAQQEEASPKNEKVVVQGKPEVERALPPPDSTTDGTVTVGGQKIPYRAVAGTLTIGASDATDSMLGLNGEWLPDAGMAPPDPKKPQDAPATARMFYVAYFRNNVPSGTRPVIFLYNGGPGSSTMWLHMGSFGPRRVVTDGTGHPAGAPYLLTDNHDCLLDVADLVFIDAPSTGFSRVMGKDKEKSFYGIDPDAHAFARFIRRFLTKYDRWNSPKYLFGESYGTPRSAVVSAMLRNTDLNGIILLSTILSFDNSVDDPRWNPGVDQAYALALPTYAATAFYHHKLTNQPAALVPFLDEVEKFALGEYEAALLQGALLPEAQRQAVAQKLHDYTGLALDYILKSNLRIAGGAFSRTLQSPDDLTTGRLDTRFSGPALDPLSEQAEYDPQSQAVSSAYNTAINQYLRQDLHYGNNQTYKPNAYGTPGFNWDLRHQAPGGPPVGDGEGGPNVMPDLATSMKLNPNMKVLVAGGYFDLATPFYEGYYEMHHLPISQSLQKNISYDYFESGHMIYVNQAALDKFHDDVAKFVRETEAPK
jgi:carboxypeptidase C (cathepsin A)